MSNTRKTYQEHKKEGRNHTGIALLVGTLLVPAGLYAANRQDTNPANQDASDLGVKINVTPINHDKLVSSKTGELHKVSYTFQHDQGLDDMRLKTHLKGDVGHVDDLIATYLPADEQELKSPRSGDTLTVLVDSDGHVVENPNNTNSADKG